MANLKEETAVQHKERFKAIETEAYESRVNIKKASQGKFEMSNDSIRTLLIGSKIWIADLNTAGTTVSYLIANLALSLTELDGHDGTFDRPEIELMRKFVEARLTHCEAERDTELNRCYETGAINSEDIPKDKFNQDTYISMKLLLLDIREWLIGEIID